MWSDFKSSVFGLLIFSGVLGGLYPLSATWLGALVFPGATEGSLMRVEGQVVGSELLATSAGKGGWFWARPSAVDYQTIPSGASNMGPTNLALSKAVGDRRAQWKNFSGDEAPDEMLTTSGSGLDPHISPESAHRQMVRICQERALSVQRCREFESQMDAHTEDRSFGLLGRKRVNVNRLNLALATWAQAESNH